jgi:hypothetical protein
MSHAAAGIPQRDPLGMPNKGTGAWNGLSESKEDAHPTPAAAKKGGQR